MELSWLSRLRLAAAVAVGIVLLAIVAHPLIRQADPYSPVTIFQQRITTQAILALLGLAFAAGFISYWLAWPYGREMAVVAAPAGLAVIAARSASLGNLIQMNPGVTDRIAAYTTFRYESLIWLAIVVAGIAGSVAARLIYQPSAASRPNAVDPRDTPITHNPKIAASVLFALALSAVIGYVGVAVFAKGIPTPTSIGTLSSQPLIAQIACGTMAAFGIAAFVVKLVFKFDWSITVAAVAVVNFASMTLAGVPRVVSDTARKFPAMMFVQDSFAILPVQLVAFGVLGALLGYWLAVRWNVWRHEVKVA